MLSTLPLSIAPNSTRASTLCIFPSSNCMLTFQAFLAIALIHLNLKCVVPLPPLFAERKMIVCRYMSLPFSTGQCHGNLVFASKGLSLTPVHGKKSKMLSPSVTTIPPAPTPVKSLSSFASPHPSTALDMIPVASVPQAFTLTIFVSLITG